MKALITGINGFIGTHLKQHLQEKNYEVKGISRTESTDNYGGDISDYTFIESVILDYKPNVIFHLAAQSNIPFSFEHPQETVQSNIIGTLNILEVLRKHSLKIKLISTGSSAEYGSTKDPNSRFTEEDIVNPSSPYAITKASQAMFIRNYNRAYNLGAVHVRPFGVVGPGRKIDAVSDFAKGMAAIERGEQEVLKVGDLSHIRDFVDVRDAVSAFEFLVSKEHDYSILNICSGDPIKLEDLVKKMASFATKEVKTEKDPAKNRPSDDPVIVGNPERLLSLGFKQKYTLDDTLRDTLEYWRKNS